MTRKFTKSILTMGAAIAALAIGASGASAEARKLAG